MKRKLPKATGATRIQSGSVSPELRRATELFHAGRVAEAAPLVDAAVARNPRDANALRIKGLIILRSGLMLEAQKILDQAHKIDPRNPMMPLDQAVIHKLSGRYPEMVESCREAMKRMPGSRSAEAMLAQAYEGGGFTEQAIRFIEATVAKRGLDAEMGETYANVLELAGRRDDALVVVERLLAASTTPPPVRRRLLLHRGRMLEKLGRCDEAMDSFNAGHAVFPVVFDPDEWDRRLDSIIEATTPMSLPEEMSDAASSEIPIFIASMPRSGTSLVERIIGIHPAAHGAGETSLIGDVLRGARDRIGQEPYQGVRNATPEILEALRRDYLERQAGMFGHSGRIVNKHLQNWHFLPIIAAWFPKAPVIRIDRAPADIGISIYGQNLSHDRMPWATRLDWIGRMIRSHQRFSDAMKDRIPNPWLDLDYSNLVTEPEPVIRSLIDFLGLEWDDRCLEPHRSEQGRGGRRYMPTLSIHQVRQPIGRGSLDRAASFGDRMAPLHRGLAGDG